MTTIANNTMLENIVSTGKKSTREGYGAGLYEVGKQNPEVVAQ